MTKKFALVKGDVVNAVVIAEGELETGTGEVWIDLTGVTPEPARDWTYINGAFAPPVPPSFPNIISKAAFRFRLTDSEYVGILNAAKTDTEVQAWHETFNMVATIDLDSQRTKDGVANLVSKNLLTQARADEILTAPVQPNEMA